MVIDEEQLRKAQSAAALLAESERQTLVARADYHTSIRRLHLAGASFRELAQELGLSHQRVQQIVEGAGGSWWQRVWRTRAPQRDAVCTFCESPPSEVSKLLAGPNVFICDGCIASAATVLAGKRRGHPGLKLADARARVACSFCGKKRDHSRPIVTASNACVCAECLTICRQIAEDRAPA